MNQLIGLTSGQAEKAKNKITGFLSAYKTGLVLHEQRNHMDSEKKYFHLKISLHTWVVDEENW